MCLRIFLAKVGRWIFPEFPVQATDVSGSLHDHPFQLRCPNVFSLVGDPLSGNGCGSPNHALLVISFLFLVLFTHFILDIKKRRPVSS
jgi:hypothetical protein